MFEDIKLIVMDLEGVRIQRFLTWFHLCPRIDVEVKNEFSRLDFFFYNIGMITKTFYIEYFNKMNLLLDLVSFAKKINRCFLWGLVDCFNSCSLCVFRDDSVCTLVKISLYLEKTYWSYLRWITCNTSVLIYFLLLYWDKGKS